MKKDVAPTITDSIHAVHVMVEVFGGKFLLQMGKSGKWTSGAYGDARDDETHKLSALRVLREDLGLKAESRELRLICVLRPSVITHQKYITSFSYLMDPEKEELELNMDKINEVVISKLVHVVDDVEQHKDEYAPEFVEVFNVFLALEKNVGRKYNG